MSTLLFSKDYITDDAEYVRKDFSLRDLHLKRNCGKAYVAAQKANDREKGRSRMTEKEGKAQRATNETVKAEKSSKSHFIIALNNHVLSKTRRVRSASGKHP